MSYSFPCKSLTFTSHPSEICLTSPVRIGQRGMKLASVVLHLVIAVFMAWITEASCSGITVTNVSLGTRNATTGDAPINFDISWDNSWRSTNSGAPAPNNWDAAWVFVKFRKNGGGWTHASLSDSGHTVPSGASLDVGLVDTGASFNIATNPGVGVFIYRSADGVGTFAKSGFALNWKFAQDGVGTGDAVDIRVFAVEMVYVPTGSFFAGDNATASLAFKQGSSDNDPWYIGSESAITTTNTAGTGTGLAETADEYFYPGGGDAAGSIFTIPAAFPKGYEKFYMMKGEISQGQFVAFFNTLTATQKSTRDLTGTSGKNSDNLVARNNVSWGGSGDATTPDQGAGATYEYVAVNYFSWADLIAYLDWAGLRPMSELEFEKAGRGPYRPVSGEYAWGSTSATQAQSITDGGKATEAPGSAANLTYGPHANVPGPMRVGAMAFGDSTRVASGAGYYGAMDLSGNMYERTVTVGSSTGRLFDRAKHGNGTLTSTGHGDVSSWPGTTAVGAGYRGGTWNRALGLNRLSDRTYTAQFDASRGDNEGGRGVRSAP